MKKIGNKLSEIFNTDLLTHIGLLLTAIFSLSALLFTVYYYFNGDISHAIFWAIMLISSEVGHVGFKLEKLKLQRTNSTYSTNVTLDMSKMKDSK